MWHVLGNKKNLTLWTVTILIGMAITVVLYFSFRFLLVSVKTALPGSFEKTFPSEHFNIPQKN